MTYGKRIGSLFLVLCLTLALLPLPSVFAADLTGATVTLEQEIYMYNGEAKAPAVTVTKDGQTLRQNLDYNVQYLDNVKAGTAVVKVTGVGSSVPIEKRFTIRPKELGGDAFTTQYVKEYDGTKTAQPVIRAEVVEGDRVTVNYVSAEFDSAEVGTDQKLIVTAVSLAGEDSGNYTVPEGLILELSGQIVAKGIGIPATAEVHVGEKLDFSKLIPGATKHDTFIMPESADMLGCTIDGAVLKAGDKEGIVQVQVASGDVQQMVTVTIRKADTSGLKKQEPLVITGERSVVYGQTLPLEVSGGSGTGAVTMEIKPMEGNAIITEDGVLCPTKAGKIWVTAVKAGDAAYEPVRSDAVEITIRQAELTITVKDKSAVLKAEVPELTAEDYEVTGLLGDDKLKTPPTLSYASAPDMTLPGTVAIRAAGAEPPEGGNYNPNIIYKEGALTIAAALYPITLEITGEGTLTADAEKAAGGATVTLQVTPKEGSRLKTLDVTAEDGTEITLIETGEGRYTFVMPEKPVKVSGVFGLPLVNPFTDVLESDWFYPNVMYVYEKGLMNGTSATAFSPNDTTTRGMIVTILYRMDGSPMGNESLPFDDVAMEMYYARPIAWAAGNGIVNGVGDRLFQPDVPITREQMAAILYRYAVHKGYDVSARGNLTRFADWEQIQSYAVQALSWANGEGLINGKGEGILDPGGPATRAQAAAILQRFQEKNQ